MKEERKSIENMVKISRQIGSEKIISTHIKGKNILLEKFKILIKIKSLKGIILRRKNTIVSVNVLFVEMNHIWPINVQRENKI